MSPKMKRKKKKAKISSDAYLSSRSWRRNDQVGTDTNGEGKNGERGDSEHVCLSYSGGISLERVSSGVSVSLLIYLQLFAEKAGGRVVVGAKHWRNKTINCQGTTGVASIQFGYRMYTVLYSLVFPIYVAN